MLIDLRNLLSGAKDDMTVSAPLEMETFRTALAEYPVMEKQPVELVLTRTGKDIDGYNLDVDKLVFGEILLLIPGKTLCKEDCKGLCLRCGANLNEGECGCDRESLDPRMSVFKDILNNFKEV